MAIYIDSEYRCHASNLDGIFRKVQTDCFSGQCETFIGGYRFVPAGESWTREDGVIFTGEMIAPWKDWHELDSAQRAYEREQLEAVRIENDELLSALAAMVDVVYESDLERIEA